MRPESYNRHGMRKTLIGQFPELAAVIVALLEGDRYDSGQFQTWQEPNDNDDNGRYVPNALGRELLKAWVQLEWQREGEKAICTIRAAATIGTPRFNPWRD